MIDLPTRQSPDIDPKVAVYLSRMTENDLYSYLREAACDYEPMLDTVVNLCEYSRKLVSLGTVFSAEVDGTVVGVLAGYFNKKDLGFAFVSQFHVRKQFRRMHIGRMLMDKAISFATEQGIRSVRLKVGKNNPTAIAFYESVGFGKIGEDSLQNEMQLSLQK